jgi:16S rRNA (cytidine1402-2'-O)-methyltransferase
MDAGLYIVGTPIGNLNDISARALACLAEADVVLAEDTRHTRKLMSRHDLHTPLQSCHKFNEAQRIVQVLERIERGAAVALVTDSGMPCISDPGARVADACRDAGLSVEVVPGPSAVTTALALSGFAADRFVFEGFLPVKSGGRGRRLAELAEEPRTIVLFESPHRLLKLLQQLAEVMATREVFVAREMTKRFEEHLRGPPGDVLEAFAGRTVKGECVVVIAPAGR